MISKNIAERPLNVTSVPNIFKSFIKEVYEKEWTQNIKKKKNLQINYFRAEIGQKEQQLLRRKVKKRMDF